MSPAVKRSCWDTIDITDALRVTSTKSNVTVEGFVKEPASTGPDASIEDVARSMREHKTDSAAIIDKDRHILGGVLLSDIFPVIITRNELRGQTKNHMSAEVATVDPCDTLQQVYARVTESGFMAFPVVKKKTACGHCLTPRPDPVGECPACPLRTRARKRPVT